MLVCQVSSVISNSLRPLDCSPSFSVHGIIQARIQESVAMPSSRGIFLTQGLNPHLLRLLHGWWILYHWATREAPIKSLNLLRRIQSEKENNVHNIHLYFQNVFLYIIVAILYIREGNGTPLQYSCLENPTDGGAWWAAVFGVTQSRTRLERLSSILYIFRKYMKECT